jgi:hypothetical protein
LASLRESTLSFYRKRLCGHDIIGSEFGRFASENLPAQEFMSALNRQYLGLNFDLKYTLDDYVILAKR